MKLDEINLKILNLKRLRKELYGVPLRDDISSLNTLKYSKQLFQRVLENSLLQEKPFYIVCNEIGLSSATIYNLKKRRVGKRVENIILEYLNQYN